MSSCRGRGRGVIGGVVRSSPSGQGLNDIYIFRKDDVILSLHFILKFNCGHLKPI